MYRNFNSRHRKAYRRTEGVRFKGGQNTNGRKVIMKKQNNKSRSSGYRVKRKMGMFTLLMTHKMAVKYTGREEHLDSQFSVIPATKLSCLHSFSYWRTLSRPS